MTKETLKKSEGSIDDSFLIESGINVRDLMFFVNTCCNLQCKHCYVGDDKTKNLQFDRGEAINILTHFAENGLDRLSFLGGEPSIYPHISELIKLASSYDIPEKRITTNGMNLKFIESISPSDLDHISFSVDGHTAELHEYLRGKKTFEKVVSSIKKAQDKGFTTNITYTVNGINKDYVEEGLLFFKELGIDEVNFHLTSMIGDAKSNQELYVTPSEWVSLRKRLVEPNDELSGLKLRIPYMFVDKEEYAEGMDGVYSCLINGSYHSPDGGNRILITPTGKVYVCCMLSSSEFNFGFLRNDAFIPNPQKNELCELRKHPKHPCIATKLLNVDTNGYIPLCISYKQKVTL